MTGAGPGAATPRVPPAAAPRLGQRRPRSLPAGHPSAYACPECHGVLWEINEGKLAHFRCRVGHAYSTESLAADLTDHAEQALWAALRALRERAGLARRMSLDQVHDSSAEQFRARAEADEAHAAALLRLIEHQEPLPE